MTALRGRNAVVIGAGMAGLLAARVLAPHFERVTIVERDRLPDSACARKGVPQGRHPHGLLQAGREVLSRLFPDLLPELIASGAVLVDVGNDLRWYRGAVRSPRFPCGVETLYTTRPCLEEHIRRRVLALASVDVVDESAALRLELAQGAGIVVGGVRVARRGQGGREELLPAELVIDAAGRGSPTPRWLAALGLGEPAEEAIAVGVGYASRLLAGVETDGWKALHVTPGPQQRKGAVLVPVAADRWIVSLFGRMAGPPPASEEAFADHIKELAVPDLTRGLARAQPLTSIATFRFPARVWRRFEAAPIWPEGLIVLGDALCSLNPIHAQGMTAAALQAAVLERCLHEHRAHIPGRPSVGFSRTFQARVASIVRAVWRLTEDEERQFAATSVAPRRNTLARWYRDRARQQSAHDVVVAAALFEIAHLVKPPSSLLQPGVLGRVLLGSRRSCGRQI